MYEPKTATARANKMTKRYNPDGKISSNGISVKRLNCKVSVMDVSSPTIVPRKQVEMMMQRAS